MIRRSVWYNDSRPRQIPIIKGRITCVNLQGQGMKGFFVKREVIKSMFTIELSIGPFVWIAIHSFDEFKYFYSQLHRDPYLQASISRLTVPFPEGVDGSDDVMVLVERKEVLDAFVKEVLSQINYELYPPLHRFIICDNKLEIFVQRISMTQRLIRRYLAKKRFNQMLFKFYSLELNRFIYSMEDGIAVIEVNNPVDPYAMDGNGTVPPRGQQTGKMKQEQVMWLDLSEEPALSRLCVAPREIYDLPREWEDKRLATGLFVSDIAEVRCGASSYGFSCSEVPIDASLSFSVVGSERTLDVQLLDESDFTRSHFIEMLRLLVLQSLPDNDVLLRNKHWVRMISPWGEGPWPTPASILSRKRKEAEMLSKLLINSIQVDEEVYSPECGLHTVPRLLRYSKEDNTLYISDDPAAEKNGDVNDDEDHQLSCVRCMDIDDISEIRPGKLSSVIDGSEDVLMLTIIASETILCLPVQSLNMRNVLIRRFQSFVEVHRSSLVARESSAGLQSRAVASRNIVLDDNMNNNHHHADKNSFRTPVTSRSAAAGPPSTARGGRSTVGMFEIPLGRPSQSSDGGVAEGPGSSTRRPSASSTSSNSPRPGTEEASPLVGLTLPEDGNDSPDESVTPLTPFSPLKQSRVIAEMKLPLGVLPSSTEPTYYGSLPAPNYIETVMTPKPDIISDEDATPKKRKSLPPQTTTTTHFHSNCSVPGAGVVPHQLRSISMIRSACAATPRGSSMSLATYRNSLENLDAALSPASFRADSST